ncbi:MAG: hypothetical protein Q8941_23905 [Bacteroidota bacterium]|nr:hypothetical protein [Bacteroidota bacterium]
MSAKQRGDRKLKGSIGDTTYKRGKNGNYTAYEKVESPAKKIATDPRFIRTRENGSEFGRAGNAGKLIRDAIRSKMKLSGDSSSIPRLLSELLRVIKADPVSDRGMRTVTHGPVESLEGFDFNVTAPLSIILPVPFTPTIDRAAGNMKVDIPGFIPDKMMKVPTGATHFRIISVALELDFETGQFIADSKSSDNLPWNNEVMADIHLILTVTLGSTKILFLLLGLEFNQLVNGKFYSITSADFSSLKLVKVSAA